MKTTVIGATGTIGSAVVSLLAERGNDVTAASRHSDPAIDLDDPAAIDAFFAAIDNQDAVICTAGNAGFGPLAELTDDQVRLGLDSKLLGQVNVVRKGLGRLKPGGVFVLTGGMLAYSPWPGTAAVALVNAGLEGFARAAALDLDGDRRIVVVHPPLVAETAKVMGMDPAPWPDAATVARTYLAALEIGGSGMPLFVDGFGPE